MIPETPQPMRVVILEGSFTVQGSTPNPAARTALTVASSRYFSFGLRAMAPKSLSVATGSFRGLSMSTAMSIFGSAFFTRFR